MERIGKSLQNAARPPGTDSLPDESGSLRQRRTIIVTTNGHVGACRPLSRFGLREHQAHAWAMNSVPVGWKECVVLSTAIRQIMS
jgi:hypothetical protein